MYNLGVWTHQTFLHSLHTLSQCIACLWSPWPKREKKREDSVWISWVMGSWWWCGAHFVREVLQCSSLQATTGMRHFLTIKNPLLILLHQLVPHALNTDTLAFHDMPCCIRLLSWLPACFKPIYTHKHHSIKENALTFVTGKKKNRTVGYVFIEVGNWYKCWISTCPHLFISRKQWDRFTLAFHMGRA